MRAAIEFLVLLAALGLAVIMGIWVINAAKIAFWIYQIFG